MNDIANWESRENTATSRFVVIESLDHEKPFELRAFEPLSSLKA